MRRIKLLLAVALLICVNPIAAGAGGTSGKGVVEWLRAAKRT